MLLGARAALAVRCAARGARALCSGAELHPAVIRRVAALDTLNSKQNELEVDHLQKLRALEAALLEKSAEVQKRRHAITSGVSEPTDDEISASSLIEAPSADEIAAAADSAPSGVPQFWEKAMRNCEGLHPEALYEVTGGEGDHEIITERDWSVLAHLSNVEVAEWTPPIPQWEDEEEQLSPDDLDEEMGGFSLTFTFAPNPYLRSEKLSVYCYAHGEVADATAPEWAEGMDPTVSPQKPKKKAAPKKKGKRADAMKADKACDSFFRIFQVPDAEDFDEMESSDGGLAVSELQEVVVLTVKEQLAPHAAAYYVRSLIDDGMEVNDDALRGVYGEPGMHDVDDGKWDYEDEDWEEMPKKGKGK